MDVVGRLRKSLKVNCLLYGDINEKQVWSITENIKNFLSKAVDLEEVKFTDIITNLNKHKIIDGTFIYNEQNTLATELNHVTFNVFQAGPRDPKISNVMQLIKMAWGNMFYYNLRTLKQLGYIVWSEKIDKNNYSVNINA